MLKHKLKFKFLSILVLGVMLFHLGNLTFARENIPGVIIASIGIPCDSTGTNGPGGSSGFGICVATATCAPFLQIFGFAYVNESCPAKFVRNEADFRQVGAGKLEGSELAVVINNGLNRRFKLETLDCDGKKIIHVNTNVPAACFWSPPGGGDPGGGDPGGGGGEECDYCFWNWDTDDSCNGDPWETNYCGDDGGGNF